ncbi:holo-[acyl-carrier-protein] synthase [Mailhella massiliensis]|uniref:Holo-[acyl-carrier-protein] synthase n=1 Tax=Mailhella massiliensis TaxID=1903261 RepID=A0A921AWL7_9BACT|nr:holo-[acyl-carrier-protein] synthase [Mailhella massiliensis]HJD97210.1 holo-[acyl-carrier-protein] synthase [Mailhella massiliensis]
MIQGTGFDLTALPRIQNLLETYGERFLSRLLTPRERAALPAAPAARTAFVAGRFAAKEAAVKALGTGFAHGIGMQEVEILTLPSGKPELRLYGAALARAESMGVRTAHISLSHERDMAGAVVILES